MYTYIHNTRRAAASSARAFWVTILYHTILYYTILYYDILHYITLHYTILYYTILYYTIRILGGLQNLLPGHPPARVAACPACPALAWRTYICTYVHIYIYIHIYTYIHTYIHTYILVCLLLVLLLLVCLLSGAGQQFLPRDSMAKACLFTDTGNNDNDNDNDNAHRGSIHINDELLLAPLARLSPGGASRRGRAEQRVGHRVECSIV